MNKNIRRIAAALSLTVILASTPAFAGPSRDGSGAPERPGIVRLIKKVMRLIGIKVTAEPTLPIPGPNANGD